MIDEKWAHSIKEGKEILIGTYIGEYGSTQELIETLGKRIDRLQTGVFLTVNEKTKQALAVFITRDSRLDADRYKRNCLAMFKKAELKGNAEFRQAKGIITGTAKINTGILGETLEGKDFKKMITEAFDGIRDRTINTLIKKGYSKGKIGP